MGITTKTVGIIEYGTAKRRIDWRYANGSDFLAESNAKVEFEHTSK